VAGSLKTASHSGLTLVELDGRAVLGLDLEFYDRFFRPGAYLCTQTEPM